MIVSPKQERTPIRTFEQLLRRYDLEAIASIKIATENVTIGLNKTNATVEEFVTATIGTLENMQNQIDGNISTWFYKGAPTLNNTPANEWATTVEKDAHLGDLYYDQDTGYGYRFSVTNGDYNWIKLTDNDVVEALAIANAAQDTADGKRRVFTDTPSPPYDVGDLWFKEKEIYICRAAKSAGSKYESDDFGIATKYTDDTKANEVANDLAKNYSTTVEVNSAISKSASEILVNIAATYTTKNELTNEIAALEEQYTAVSLKADGLETTVKSHTTQIGDLSTRVTSTESSITQHAKEIDLRVKSDSVIAAINLTSETALIAAKHIDLVGAVTFSSLDSSTQSKIDTASTNASNAVSAANTASTTANTANTNATNALNRATYHYGTCGTAAATAAKAVTLSGFSLYTGAMVSVYFTYANTAASPTLNVNGTGAKGIRVNNAVITAKYYWRAGDTVTFIYNGTYWVLADTSANSILASWCSDNDRTLIDGGKIYASEAFLQNIFSKNITATGTITGAHIAGAYGEFTQGFKVDIPYNTTLGESFIMELKGAEFGLYMNTDDGQGVCGIYMNPATGITMDAYQGIDVYAPRGVSITGAFRARTIETEAGVDLDELNSKMVKMIDVHHSVTMNGISSVTGTISYSIPAGSTILNVMTFDMSGYAAWRIIDWHGMTETSATFGIRNLYNGNLTFNLIFRIIYI